jgi:RNA polymerase sigma-70 factor (ECF subfamily)
MKTKFALGCLIAALLQAILATPALAVDLLKQYPTQLVKGDATPENARPWEFEKQDIFRVSHFSLAVGHEVKVETGTADLGIGHCADGAVWAVLIPREDGTLTSLVAKQTEAIAHVWLRFHPAQINRLFSSASVSANGNADLIAKMRDIVNAKFRSSWHAGMNAMIPEPKDMTVYIDTKDGAHRFFMVDTEKKTAEYVAAFNKSSESSPISWETAPPVVIKTVPEAGATDVPPGVTEIQVTFSKEMMDESWSWCDVWENSTPEGVDKPSYDASHRTCTTKVKLEPNKVYGYWLNTQNYRHFQDPQHRAAVPYLLTFRTAASSSIGQAPGADMRINPRTGLPAGKSDGLSPATADHANATVVAYQHASEVHDLITDGRYDDALQRCLAFHEQYKSSGALIPLLNDWVELGRRYPKAREALIEIRDHDAKEFAAGRGYTDLFSEVNSINGALHLDDATYELFKSFRDKDPDLAQQCYFYVESLLVGKGEYQWCYDHMGDPQGRFDSIRQSLTMQLDTQKRMAAMQKQSAQRMAEINQKNGWTNVPAYSMPDTSSMIKKSAEKGFVSQTRQLIEILVATGLKTDAEKIRDQAVTVLDDERLKSAVADAEEKVHSKSAQPESK